MPWPSLIAPLSSASAAWDVPLRPLLLAFLFPPVFKVLWAGADLTCLRKGLSKYLVTLVKSWGVVFMSRKFPFIKTESGFFFFNVYFRA